MQIEVVKEGSDKFVIIPEDILEQCGIKDKVELTVQDNKIYIAPLVED